MKPLLILLLLFLIACTATIKVRVHDPVTGNLLTSVDYNSARKALIRVEGIKVDIVTGEVAISQETAQVLVKELTDIPR